MSTTDLNVHLGVWTNWAKGSSEGRTLTLTSQNGTILIAALALFVSIAAAQFWGMLSFFVHQLRTSRKPQYGIHFQQQTTLRNHGSPLATVWQLVKISWAWRSQSVGSFKKSIGLVMLGLVYLMMFGAASLFSSRVATASDEVLVRSPNCGIWILSPDMSSDFDQATDFNVHQRVNADLSKSYVRDCLSGYQSSPECNIFKQRAIPYLSMNNATCPFSPEMCLGSPNTALSFDSTLLDSNHDFGINSLPKDRVSYRKVATCSPVTTDGYLESGESELKGRGYNYTAAHYGTNNMMDSSRDMYGGVDNATYVHTDYKALELGYDVQSGAPLYSVFVASAPPTSPHLGFTPIEALNAPNSTVSLVFASFDGYSVAPSDDLWLPSHQKSEVSVYDPGFAPRNVTIYKPDKSVNVLGCTEQHQFCNPNRPADSESRCTPLMDWGTLGLLFDNYTSEILDTNHQIEALTIIMYAALAAELRNTVPYFHAPLLASDYTSGFMSSAMPPNQWQLETENWFSTGMNIIQRYVAETATGAPGKYAKYTTNSQANATELQWFCANYIMRDSAYQSFSILALSLIAGFGGLAIFASLWLETTIGWIQTKLNRGTFHKMCWKLDSALQLQRMAYEEAGMGNWVRCADDIPLTEKGNQISLPAEWDEWHPTVAGRPVPHTPMFDDGRAVMMQKQSTMVTVSSETTLAPTVERRPTLLRLSSDEETSREVEEADVISPVTPPMSPTIPAANPTPSPLSKEVVVVAVQEQRDGSS
ncbi:hypothetical protein ONS95_009585 [Cadophora gregata]|uniref:uncharacterized protein n=1 Tax=Cadophora gregata TaxID=51156 RepID=UPI0026DBF2E1|nr:uncharacterized protein ONS95_009585 [Cadophora gregata]KAK0124638.1 hypothetical protein ONS95_009585 [Cadophora gregata]KAK0129505.1 hypothetical protein ONS96_000071 [Cadophora gregata f. sp. sojae]